MYLFSRQMAAGTMYAEKLWFETIGFFVFATPSKVTIKMANGITLANLPKSFRLSSPSLPNSMYEFTCALAGRLQILFFEPGEKAVMDSLRDNTEIEGVYFNDGPAPSQSYGLFKPVLGGMLQNQGSGLFRVESLQTPDGLGLKIVGYNTNTGGALNAPNMAIGFTPYGYGLARLHLYDPTGSWTAGLIVVIDSWGMTLPIYSESALGVALDTNPLNIAADPSITSRAFRIDLAGVYVVNFATDGAFNGDITLRLCMSPVPSSIGM